jgi:hypothetical protein
MANLKFGEVRISGTLRQYQGCVSEASLTQYGGMTAPEFWLTYSEINGVRSHRAGKLEDAR